MSVGRVYRYANNVAEGDRFESPHGLLGFLRSKKIIERILPQGPSRILDVGEDAGVHSFWLAELGHHVDVVDPSYWYMEIIKEKNDLLGGSLAGMIVGQATDLPFPDRSFDLVLLTGPLYRNQDRTARIKALCESHRVLKPAGILAASFLSRYAADNDRFRHECFSDMYDMSYMDLVCLEFDSGISLPDPGSGEFSAESNFYESREISAEMTETGFGDATIYPVDGFSWTLSDLKETIDDACEWELVSEWIERTNTASAFIGNCAHFFSIAIKE